ncbi:VOC family protein [Roseibium album]|uniref:Biphenyl-2,3-diol 1,2-dioxygenase n=1 Tax=Roseibium album TaxID=311410 RepID=A0A0M7ABN1_9HYPH|nr:VOC family protein [Roseibium album]CTQ61147.1 Biphenyl-2,3-diol 1,2-dioxygenase [Roseibium album]CTQ63789.1 Biphenyl-2,3-diol 1,2-dioxygenase [Roseibium album]CTQ72289.1 Biphenyl-2,3-diol 1,2-dioxygenase [Roseibium album]
MAICALGYLGVRSDNLDDWSEFAGGLLGMQKVDAGGQNLSFRMDDRKQRLVVANEPGDALSFMGWEVETADDLQRYAQRLDTANIAVQPGSRDLADRRFVEQLIQFDDPAGNRIELFYKPMVTTDRFVPGRPHSGFKTGTLGMGHAVLCVADPDLLVPFYTDLLDFQLSDYGLKPVPLYFFHVNGRHHSFALVGGGSAGFHHFMIEFGTLDDVGQGHDLAIEQDLIAYTLGRHTNDWITSFYARSPSGFFVESGWGGRIIDPAAWEPHETSVGPSFWGHDRPYLREELRRKFKEKRLELAARGIQAPPIVDCPWLYGEIAKSG